MNRRTLRSLFLGVMIFAGPCFVTADTTPKKTTTAPKAGPKTGPKTGPQVIQPTTPSGSSRSHGSHGYHPHQAKGGAKQSKRPSHSH
ncbi:MAG TPA: hypothetical protein VFG04_16170 [Planctomycetaceae bacterium]|jgi:hypothetical protein|nr:hypothetical protein [Planctomycetaceae bacterium]